MKYTSIRVRLFLSALLLSLISPLVLAGDPGYESGKTGLALALRRLPVTARFLHITAHPDDEDNPLLVLLNRGQGVRTGLLTLTRGEGGQNEIGPELFEALGIIRTEELMTMHRYDGAEQFFTRAYEFGYSFSVQETFEKWGRDEILRDIVRVIRTFRPDVIGCLPRSGEGGGQHHQASAQLAEEAFWASGDPGRFPEQIAEGLPAWKPSRLYERYRWGGSPAGADPEQARVQVETGIYDAWLGGTFAQIGGKSRAAHRCQGMGQLTPLPGSSTSEWTLIGSQPGDSVPRGDLFGGMAKSLTGLERLAEGRVRTLLHAGLSGVDNRIRAAQDAFRTSDPDSTLSHLLQGLAGIRDLREQVRLSGSEGADFDHLNFLLAEKERDFLDAVRLASGIQVQVLADDGLVVPGQEFALTLSLSNAGGRSLDVENLELDFPAGWSLVSGSLEGLRLEAGHSELRRLGIRVGKESEPSRPYWKRVDSEVDRFEVDPRFFSRPWADSEVVARFLCRVEDVPFAVEQTAEYRYDGPWVGGEQRHDLMVVPAVTLSAEPRFNVLPLSEAKLGRQMRIRLSHHGKGELSGSVRLEVPEGWRVEPASQDIRFDREGQTLISLFRLYPPGQTRGGAHRIGLVGEFEGNTYRESLQLIDYDHIRLRPYFQAGDFSVEVLDVKVSEEPKVAYIEGVGDEVAEALQQLGVKVSFLDSEGLAFADLNGYDVIVTGLRAYLVREDLVSFNSRLLKWVENGGTLIVQYNKLEFNEGGRGDSPYAPFPARVGRGRVTDEDAPVRVLQPEHPVFLSPNRISEADWEGWVQERGLYFLGEKSEDYRDLVAITDSFDFNPGVQMGGLVEARLGKGRWIYVGLGLWRQLPAGVPGAFRLLANLVSLGRAE